MSWPASHVSGLGVIQSASRSVAGSAPAAPKRTRSRSVRMPMGLGPSTTTTDPTRWASIREAASAIVSSGSAVTTGALIRSPAVLGWGPVSGVVDGWDPLMGSTIAGGPRSSETRTSAGASEADDVRCAGAPGHAPGVEHQGAAGDHRGVVDVRVAGQDGHAVLMGQDGGRQRFGPQLPAAQVDRGDVGVVVRT